MLLLALLTTLVNSNTLSCDFADMTLDCLTEGFEFTFGTCVLSEDVNGALYTIEAVNAANDATCDVTLAGLKSELKWSEACVDSPDLTSTTQIYLNTVINGFTVAIAEKTVDCTHEGEFTVSVTMGLLDSEGHKTDIPTSQAHMKLYEAGQTNSTTELKIGDTIRVVVDYGRELDSRFKLQMDKCTYSADSNVITLVESDIANAELSGMVKTELDGITLTDGISGTNAHAEFEMHVFQLGRGDSGTFSCDMKIVAV